MKNVIELHPYNRFGMTFTTGYVHARAYASLTIDQKIMKKAINVSLGGSYKNGRHDNITNLNCLGVLNNKSYRGITSRKSEEIGRDL